MNLCVHICRPSIYWEGMEVIAYQKHGACLTPRTCYLNIILQKNPTFWHWKQWHFSRAFLFSQNFPFLPHPPTHQPKRSSVSSAFPSGTGSQKNRSRNLPPRGVEGEELPVATATGAGRGRLPYSASGVRLVPVAKVLGRGLCGYSVSLSSGLKPDPDSAPTATST